MQGRKRERDETDLDSELPTAKRTTRKPSNSWLRRFYDSASSTFSSIFTLQKRARTESIESDEEESVSEQIPTIPSLSAIEISTPPSPGLTPSQSPLKRTRVEDTNEVESLVLTPPPSSSPSPSPSRTSRRRLTKSVSPGKRIPAKKLAAEVEVIPPKRLYPTLDEKYGSQAAVAGHGSEGGTGSNPVKDGTNAAGSLYPSLADSTSTENPITVSDSSSLGENTMAAAAAASDAEEESTLYPSINVPTLLEMSSAASEAGTPAVHPTTDVSAQEASTYSSIVITTTTLDVSAEILTEETDVSITAEKGSEAVSDDDAVAETVRSNGTSTPETTTYPSIIITDTSLEVSAEVVSEQSGDIISAEEEVKFFSEEVEEGGLEEDGMAAPAAGETLGEAGSETAASVPSEMIQSTEEIPEIWEEEVIEKVEEQHTSSEQHNHLPDFQREDFERSDEIEGGVSAGGADEPKSVEDEKEQVELEEADELMVVDDADEQKSGNQADEHMSSADDGDISDDGEYMAAYVAGAPWESHSISSEREQTDVSVNGTDDYISVEDGSNQHVSADEVDQPAAQTPAVLEPDVIELDSGSEDGYEDEEGYEEEAGYEDEAEHEVEAGYEGEASYEDGSAEGDWEGDDDGQEDAAEEGDWHGNEDGSEEGYGHGYDDESNEGYGLEYSQQQTPGIPQSAAKDDLQDEEVIDLTSDSDQGEGSGDDGHHGGHHGAGYGGHGHGFGGQGSSGQGNRGQGSGAGAGGSGGGGGDDDDDGDDDDGDELEGDDDREDEEEEEEGEVEDDEGYSDEVFTVEDNDEHEVRDKEVEFVDLTDESGPDENRSENGNVPSSQIPPLPPKPNGKGKEVERPKIPSLPPKPNGKGKEVERPKQNEKVFVLDSDSDSEVVQEPPKPVVKAAPTATPLTPATPNILTRSAPEPFVANTGAQRMAGGIYPNLGGSSNIMNDRKATNGYKHNATTPSIPPGFAFLGSPSLVNPLQTGPSSSSSTFQVQNSLITPTIEAHARTTRHHPYSVRFDPSRSQSTYGNSSLPWPLSSPLSKTDRVKLGTSLFGSVDKIPADFGKVVVNSFGERKVWSNLRKPRRRTFTINERIEKAERRQAKIRFHSQFIGHPALKRAEALGFKGTSQEFNGLVDWIQYSPNKRGGGGGASLPLPPNMDESTRAAAAAIHDFEEEDPVIHDLRRRIEGTRMAFKKAVELQPPEARTPLYDALIRKEREERERRLEAERQAHIREFEAERERQRAQRRLVNFKSFTAEQREKIAAALDGPSSALLNKIGPNPITRKDVLTLRDGQWLNDEVINGWMNMISERAKKDEPRYGKVWCFNTYFYERLSSDKGYGAVKSWSKKNNFFEWDFVLFPVHVHGNHWIACVLDMKHKSIELYDSFRGGHSDVIKNVKMWLENEWQRHYPGGNINWEEWDVATPRDIPPQRNGYDCGVFATNFLEYRVRCADFDFTERDMPYMRKRMILELLQGWFEDRA
ncbi:hypothetical protein HDV00_008675 [Rhizophlyctis rosea]|nr:hypothetical protein HDV00_008675 [Rhizophlyctis rosea]